MKNALLTTLLTLASVTASAAGLFPSKQAAPYQVLTVKEAATFDDLFETSKVDEWSPGPNVKSKADSLYNACHDLVSINLDDPRSASFVPGAVVVFYPKQHYAVTGKVSFKSNGHLMHKTYGCFMRDWGAKTQAIVVISNLK